MRGTAPRGKEQAADREAGPQLRGSEAEGSQWTTAGGLGIVSGHAVWCSGQGVRAWSAIG